MSSMINIARIDCRATITAKEVIYERNTRNSKWHEAQVKPPEKIDRIHVVNYVNAAKAFRRAGSYERVEYSHTEIGYLPTKCVTISPDKLKRIEKTFEYHMPDTRVA